MSDLLILNNLERITTVYQTDCEKLILRTVLAIEIVTSFE